MKYFLIVTVIVMVLVAGLILWPKFSASPITGVALDATLIDLRGKGLTSLPAEIGNYTAATQLLLDNNKLTGALPAEIRKLTKLEVLSAKHNQLTGIPAEIGQLQHLTTIDFSDNQISTYPNELFQLQQPLELILTGNPLTTAQIAELKSKLPNAVVTF